MASRRRVEEPDDPRVGDLVRARRVGAAAPTIVGPLYLRFAPHLGLTEVLVLHERAWRAVDPDTVEVLEPSSTPPDELARLDTYTALEGWRLIPSLRADDPANSLRRATEDGEHWIELWKQLDLIVCPLVAVGWRIIEANTDGGAGYPDSVIYDLERADVQIELEYFQDGELAGYATAEMSPSDEPTEPLFELRPGRPSAADEEFRRAGWL